MNDFHLVDSRIKALAKCLRNEYRLKFKDERFYTITSTKSEKKKIWCLSCYPKEATNMVLKDWRFKEFIEENKLKFELEFKEKTKTYKINLTSLESA